MIDPAQQLQQLSILRGTKPPIPNQAQPMQDPRMQALDKYMQMQGAQMPPQMPQLMPNAQGGTRPMSLQDQQQMTDQMGQASDQAYTNNTNAYFKNLDEPDDDEQVQSAQDAEYDELNTEDDRVPTYVDNKGRPSPDKEYTDEDMLNLVGKQIDGGMQLSNNVGEAQQQIIKDPSEQNIKNFIEMHGEDNLPDDLRNPDADDPADNH